MATRSEIVNMEETKRFLRYVTPGLVLAVETTLLLYILFPDWTKENLNSMQTGVGFGGALVALLASGGIGFVLSGFQHTLHWCRWAGVVNHRPLIENLIETRTIEIRDVQGLQIPPESLSREEAWVVITALWHERVGTCKKIEGATPYASSLTDLVHSTGTARVASLFALVIALITAACIAKMAFDWKSVTRFVITIVVGLVLLLVHHCNYRRTCSLAQQFVDETLADALAAEDKRPVVTLVKFGQSRIDRQSKDSVA